jgi:hypothetical protein
MKGSWKMVRKYNKSDMSENSNNNIDKTIYSQALDSNIPAMPKENYDYLTNITGTEHENEWDMYFNITELNTAIKSIRNEAILM